MDEPEARGEQRTAPRRTDTDNPRLARTRAVKILFQADVRGVPAADVLQGIVESGQMLDDEDNLDTPVDEFTRKLVLGVEEHRGDLDDRIQRFARRWAIHRMPVVDRNLLRLGTYELLHETTTQAVVINEAVRLAKELSTEDSGRYVNGVLEAIRRNLTSGDRPGDEAPPTA